MSTRDWPIIAMYVGAIAFVLLLVYFLVTYRSVARIRIEDRWWASSTSVKWDETDREFVCTTTSDYVCSGYGDDRSCSTEVDTDCQWETTTTTYTRCKVQNSGVVLPVVYPEPGCDLHYGDYISKWHDFYVRYNQDDKQRTSPFNGDLWQSLQPGFDRNVEKNIVGRITALATE